jgi:digalactosyldiacylglycerol synthase
MCRSHCHRLIKLSGTLGEYAPEKELVENTHGVRGAFLDAGEELRKKLMSPEGETDPVFSPSAEPSVYFIGKMLWSKGIGSLMELLKYAEETAGIQLKVDMYGGGPDKEPAEEKAKKMELDMDFPGPVDHTELAMTHKVRRTRQRCIIYSLLDVRSVILTYVAHFCAILTRRSSSTLPPLKSYVQQLLRRLQWENL